ncbi:MAG: NUDIX hydrolase [Planctomycetota bacterium]|nr:NUDIX hydrolase [Planctomycetota bacterium]
MEDKIIATTPFLQLIDRNHWFFVRRPNSRGVVAILAVTANQELLIVDQYRAPLDARVLELPAGLAGDVAGHEDEPLELAAQRELLEETGYTCREMQLLVYGPSSAGMTDETVWLYLARDVVKVVAGGGDASEEICVHHVPVASAPDWISQRQVEGYFVDYKIFAGLFFIGQQSVSRSPSDL